MRMLVWILVGAAVLYLVIGLLIGGLSYNVRAFDGTWTEEQGDFSTNLPVQETTEFCLCPAYVCETGFEAVLLAQPTFWGWRRFQYFTVPSAPGAPETNQIQQSRPPSVRTDTRLEFCLTKHRSDSLNILLKQRAGDYWLSIY